MATEFISNSWLMPENSNQDKLANYSLSFDGINQKIEVSTTAFSGLSKFSLGFSVKISDVGTLQASVLQYTTAGSTGNGFRVYFSATQINVVVGNAMFRGNIIADPFSEWTNYIITFDGTVSATIDRCRVWENNVELTNTLASNVIAMQSYDTLVIGGQRTGSQPWYYYYKGQISELSFFDYALSSSQVTELYGTGSAIGNPMAITNGRKPVAYYPLGNSAFNGEFLVPNGAEQDFVFDFSTSNYISTPHISISAGFTASAWVNTTDTNTYANIFSSDEVPVGGSIRNWQFIRWNNKARFILRNSSGSSIVDINTSSKTINDGIWHNIVATWDGTTGTNGVKIYVDNVLEAQGTASSTALRNDSVLMIMGGSSTTWDLIGKMSNVSIFDTALPATGTESVESLYNYGTPPNIASYSNLQGWYELDASELYDGSNWSVQNKAIPTVYNSALSFDGINDDIDCGTISSFNDGDISFSLWCNLTSNGTVQYILSSTNSSSVSGINIAVNNSGLLYFERSQDAANTQNFTSFYVVTGFSFGNWHHLCGTYSASSGELKAYVDGVLKSTTTDSADARSASTALKIGGLSASSSFPSNGKISNVSIYSSTLDDASVQTLYNNGTPETDISFSPVSWWKLDNTTTGIEDSVGSNDGTNNGATTESSFVQTTSGTSSGMTAASLTQSDLIINAPYDSFSLEFDAVGSDRINFGNPSNLQITGSFSVSVWIKQTTQQDSVVISKDAFGSNRCWSLWSNAYQTNNFVQFIVWDESNAIFYVDSNIRVDDGNWHHLTAVYDASNSLKIYIDGVLNNTNSTSIPSSIANKTVDIILGESNTLGSFEFGGSISNCSIYSSSLSAAQVKTLYNEHKPFNLNNFAVTPVSWWRLGSVNSSFDGTNWTVLDEISTSGNNGVSANMTQADLVDGVGATGSGTSSGMGSGENRIGSAPFSENNAVSYNMSVTAKSTSTPT